MIDVNNIKSEFAVLVNDPKLVYLDSAATSLKPTVVLEAMGEYYQKYTANIKRGIYKNSMRATEEYEFAREAAAKFINSSRDEIIFTRNTTEGLNLVMYSFGTNIIEKGDEIVTTVMEHHSNFVPWQQLALQTGATFKIIDVNKKGELDIHDKHSGGVTLAGIVSKKTKILAITHVSNVLGTINPVKEIIKSARRLNPNIIVVVDGAQAVPHLKVDVKDLDCDFYSFSAHKMFGPTGVGVLYGKKDILVQMVPFQYGGEMIREVHMDHTVFADLPEKYEAGTPAIAEVIGFRHAIEFREQFSHVETSNHTKELLSHLIDSVKKEYNDAITILSNTNIDENVGVFTFTFPKIHPHDVASILDEENVAVRAGHHCAMPLHTHLGHPASARVSLSLYNTKADIDSFVKALQKVNKIFV